MWLRFVTFYVADYSFYCLLIIFWCPFYDTYIGSTIYVERLPWKLEEKGGRENRAES